MYCKDCQDWQKFDGEDFGGCISPKILHEVTMINLEFNDFKNDVMITEHDEGWGSITGSNFGCVHFAAKPNESV